MMRFYGEDLLAPRPTPKLEDHPLSAVRDCLFNIFAATLHIGGRSSIPNMRTLHVMVKGTHLSRIYIYIDLLHIEQASFNQHITTINDTYIYIYIYIVYSWLCVG